MCQMEMYLVWSPPVYFPCCSDPGTIHFDYFNNHFLFFIFFYCSKYYFSFYSCCLTVATVDSKWDWDRTVYHALFAAAVSLLWAKSITFVAIPPQILRTSDVVLSLNCWHTQLFPSRCAYHGPKSVAFILICSISVLIFSLLKKTSQLISGQLLGCGSTMFYMMNMMNMNYDFISGQEKKKFFFLP